MDFTDLNGVISQVVVNDEGKILWLAEESQYFAVIVEELLLAWYFTTT